MTRARSRRWTADEDKFLAWQWGVLSLESIAKRLNRTPGSIYYRARDKGLGVGRPRGLEYVTEAARRAGYNERDLRKILAWAGVVIQRPWTIYEAKREGVVDPERVDQAVAAWTRTDTLTNAAKRLGVTRFKLARAVERRADAPPKAGYWRIWRVPVDVLEAAAAELKARSV